jgi:hypothetical protein
MFMDAMRQVVDSGEGEAAVAQKLTKREADVLKQRVHGRPPACAKECSPWSHTAMDAGWPMNARDVVTIS